MAESDLSGARSSSIGPSRSRASGSRKPSPPTARERGSGGGGSDPNLLAPVVRSKRTPIACTECRRRQVKCSGGTPQCERCEKKGVRCEYIPIHQQRMAANTTMQHNQSAIHLYGYPSAQVSRSVPSSPDHWRHQQDQQAYPSYVPGAVPSGQEWQQHYTGTPQVSSQRYTQQTVQSAPAQLGFAYSQGYQTNESYHIASVNTAQQYTRGSAAGAAEGYTQGQSVPSQYGYAGTYDASAQAGGSAVSSNIAYSIPPTANEQLLSSQMTLPAGQLGSYQEQYYQGQHTGYDPSSPTPGQEAPYGTWAETNNPDYTGYEGHPYP
ncbi:hypothetical protein IEO21_03318 [Rhodonia placenta]|uniref:Zn(2)-C6 fungal-type domain-containing protein n=1 Tax=Rhodonia placenta TaxID=104341 RepID=A0A8H7U427_9APHY|nr:hypothetical protein IEO21_03318 [Postia placenta]